MLVNTTQAEDNLAAAGLLGLALERFTNVPANTNWRKRKPSRPSFRVLGTDPRRNQGQFFMSDDLSKLTVTLHCNASEMRQHKAQLDRSSRLSLVGSNYCSYDITCPILQECLRFFCTAVLTSPAYEALLTFSSRACIERSVKDEISAYQSFPVALASIRMTWSRPECINHNEARIQFELLHMSRRVVIKLEDWKLGPAPHSQLVAPRCTPKQDKKENSHIGSSNRALKKRRAALRAKRSSNS